MSRGIYQRTEEHRRKLSESLKGRISPMKGKHLSDETKKQMSKRCKRLGIKPPSRKGIKHTEETKKKISKNSPKYWKGKHFSQETKKKISKTKKGTIPWNKGIKMSDEFRKKISEAKIGKKLSEETKKKMSENNIRYWQGKHFSEEHKKRLSEVRRGEKHPLYGKHPSEETRRKISEAKIGKYSGEKSPNWQGGKSFEPYSSAWTPELKQAIRQRDNFTCQLCGKYPSFSVHHIDYDKKNCEPENLIILCCNCHSKTNFNREYWTKYFVEKMFGQKLDKLKKIIKINLVPLKKKGG